MRLGFPSMIGILFRILSPVRKASFGPDLQYLYSGKVVFLAIGRGPALTCEMCNIRKFYNAICWVAVGLQSTENVKKAQASV